MNIVARLKTKDEISHLIKIGTDIIMLDVSGFTAKPINSLDQKEFTHIFKEIREKQKKVYAYMNKMIHETDLEQLRSWISLFSELDIDGIVINDFTVYVIAEEYGLGKKIIYQPGTMNTNSFDALFLANKMKGMTLSKEITLDEIVEIIKSTSEIEYSIVGHGFIDMFYSKRKLITNYFIHKQLKVNQIKNNHQFVLEEKTRDSIYYPILEDEVGTHIFRDKKLKSFEEMKILEDMISDFFIERLFIDDEEYYDTIRAYIDNEARKKFEKKYISNFNSGFYYLPTEKTKGERHVD
ncbi:U32 family peptidase [Mycoplasmatota bacterium]|nr:U32 family peptidase [Mycoplasmatota bacterium]